MVDAPVPATPAFVQTAVPDSPTNSPVLCKNPEISPTVNDHRRLADATHQEVAIVDDPSNDNRTSPTLAVPADRSTPPSTSLRTQSQAVREAAFGASGEELSDVGDSCSDSGVVLSKKPIKNSRKPKNTFKEVNKLPRV